MNTANKKYIGKVVVESKHRIAAHNSVSRYMKLGLCVSLLGFSLSNALANEVADGDKKFLMAAADAEITAINAAKYAYQKSTSRDVKAYAAAAVTEQTKMRTKLAKLAEVKNVALPDEPSRLHAQKITALNSLDVKSFDVAYAGDIGIAAHKETIAMFRNAEKNAQDADVKVFASASLPALETQLQAAEKLKETLDSKPAKR